MKTLPQGIRLAFVAAALLQSAGAAAQAPDVAATLARHGIQEHSTAQREAPQWSPPRKVLLLQYGLFRDRNVAEFQAAVPGARVVSVTNTASAIREAADVDVIIGHNPEICDRRIIDAAPQLRWLASLSAGIELCANLPTLKSRPVTMTNMRGIDSPAIAEHAIALMLALAHGLDRFAVDTSRGVWARGSSVQLQTLDGKTMLVAGLGGIGTEVARRAHGLGMRVIATRVGGSGKPDFVDYVGQPDELLTLARRADVVVSCLPLTPETTGLYDQRFFAVLKPTAYFINVARGASVVTDALLAALTEGRIAGAGLDVVDPEPLPAGHPLWSAPRVLLTPHISGRTALPGEPRWIVAKENLRRYAAGDKLLNVVDLERGF
jgi:phosphoglycerate dehydrogenase-like enzyme